MKHPYALIFTDNGGLDDNLKNACGIGASFVRFLFSAVDLPYHTFWSAGGEKVVLSDGEKQILEHGIARLSELMNGGCMQLINDSNYSDNLEVSYNSDTYLTYQNGYGMSEYFTALGDNTLYCQRGGLYNFLPQVRVNGALTGAADFHHSLTIQVNGSAHNIAHDNRSLNSWQVMGLDSFLTLEEGDVVSIFYNHRRVGGAVTLQSSMTKLQVVYHG